MWIMLNNSFLSIVTLNDHPDELLVRARVDGDISAVFPSAIVEHTPLFDYPFRAIVARLEVQAAMVRAVDAINYSNFKNSVEDDARHDAYLEVWTAMRNYQRDAVRGRITTLTRRRHR